MYRWRHINKSGGVMTCLRERRSVQLGCERVGGASEADARTHARTPVRTDLAFPVSARRPDGRLFCERSVLVLPPLLLLLLL